MHVYRVGDRGAAVAEIRAKLAALGLLTDADGDRFDAACDLAVRGFQQARGLAVDGLVGPETYRALDEARWRLGDRLLFYTAAHPFIGDDVAELQRRLLDMGFDLGRTDGIFGARTEAAVRDFQRNVGLAVDGLCGPKTLDALQRLSRTVTGGRPDAMREEEWLRAGGDALAGRVVVVDPGHGDGDPGSHDGSLREADLMLDLARRLEGRLGALGVTAYLTRGPDGAPSDEDRAAFANSAGADLLVSLHCDAAPSVRCNGAATFYFGGARGGSATGERLAGLVQREIAARTAMLDCGTHPKTWDLLRLTRMPAIRLEVGYLSNPEDRARLTDPRFRDTVAEAIVVSIKRLYLPRDLDATTGELHLSVLAS